MAYALWHGKLWSVHLTDQNGPKYDQDKSFGSVDLRRAFNTVWVLERAGYDGCIGLDVKAMRTTRGEQQTQHLANSKRIFEHMVALARSVDGLKIEKFRAARDYEGLELYIVETLLAHPLAG
jgi:xylose isomerase